MTWQLVAHYATIDRGVALASGLGAGIGLGLLIVNGDVAAAVLAVVGAVGLAVWMRRGFAASEHRGLFMILSLAYTGRLALLAVLHYVLVSQGRAGHLFGDDAEYADLAWRLIRYARGEDVVIGWYGEANVFGNFLYLEAAIFYLFGPQVTIVKVLNAAFGAALVLPVFDLTRRLFSRSAGYLAAALAGFFPSLVLWSVLNLKDTLAILLTVAVIWCVTAFSTGRASWRILVPGLLALVLLVEIRDFIFLILGWITPIAVLIGATGSLRRRVLVSSATLLIVGGVMWVDRHGFLGIDLLRPTTVQLFESQREWNAANAGTAFTEPATGDVPVRPGQYFVVGEAARTLAPTLTPAPALSASPTTAVPQTAPPASPTTAVPPTAPPASVLPAPTASARVVAVAPGTELVLAGTASGSPGVEVRPGDVVVVVGSVPAGTPAPLVFRPGNDRLQIANFNPAGEAIARTLVYLPKGMAYAIGAPFPWDSRSTAGRLALPEMLAWYAILLALPAQIWRSRRLWRGLLMVLAYMLTVFGVLALSEGNVGSLLRHRAMILPFAFVLAAPIFVDLKRWLNSGVVRKAA